jgi:hypothetical protein
MEAFMRMIRNRHLRSAAILGVLLASLLGLSSCKLLEGLVTPCDDVYFKNDELMVPASCSSHSLYNMRSDENGCLVYYEFSATKCDGPDYQGSVTFTRDASCRVTSRKLVVNGKVCEQ